MCILQGVHAYMPQTRQKKLHNVHPAGLAHVHATDGTEEALRFTAVISADASYEDQQ